LDGTPLNATVPVGVPAVAELLIVTDGLEMGIDVTVLMQGFFAVKRRQLVAKAIRLARFEGPNITLDWTFKTGTVRSGFG
jgi:hypothetical protein